MHALLLAAMLCTQTTDVPTELESWRFTLDLGPRSDAEDAPRDVLPFLVELDAARSRAWIVNGTERIDVERTTRDDARWTLDFPHYDSRIELELEDGAWSGTWTKERGRAEPARVPVTAQRGDVRFEPVNGLSVAAQSLVGRWRATFETGGEIPAVAVLSEGDRASSLRGTFLTDTGDYRYLAGDVVGSRVRLSCFDGAHAFLFEAQYEPGLGEADRLVNGVFRSGDWWTETWSAERDDEVALPDPLERVGVLETAHLEFLALPNTEGNWQPLWRPGRPAVIEVFGSWCPNCHDAAQLMQELHSEHGDELDVVGVAFELTGKWQRDARQVDRFRERHDLEYTLLVGGTANKAATARALGLTERILSYPTTFFVDRNGTITAVYSGFSGPATGDAHLRLRERMELATQEVLESIPSTPSFTLESTPGENAVLERYAPRPSTNHGGSRSVSSRHPESVRFTWQHGHLQATVFPRLGGPLPSGVTRPVIPSAGRCIELPNLSNAHSSSRNEDGTWRMGRTSPLAGRLVSTTVDVVVASDLRIHYASTSEPRDPFHSVDRTTLLEGVNLESDGARLLHLYMAAVGLLDMPTEQEPPLLAPYESMLEGPDTWWRARAAAALALLGRHAGGTTPEGLARAAGRLEAAATTDPSHLVRREAARALAAWGLGADLLIRWRASDSPFDRDLGRVYAAVLAESP